MYNIQSWMMSRQGTAGSAPRDTNGRMQRRRLKTLETQRELIALISYLRQQESGVLDAMQRLQDAA